MIADLTPYAEYKESGLPWLDRIPSHWEVWRNGRLFSQRRETGFGELPILEVSLKTGVRVRDMDNLKRKQVMSDREKYKRAANGDIAYNMMRMWQGAVGVAPADGLVSPAYVVAKPYPEAEPRYFSYLFRTDAYMNEVDGYSRGIVKDRNRLYWEDFKQMPSCVPPLQEQKAIVDYLDDNAVKVSRFIRNRRKLIALLNEQKQAIINRAVTRGLDPNVRLKPSGIPWLADIPEHWEVRKISTICSLIVDGTHFSPTNDTAGAYLYITAKNIKEYGVDVSTATYVSPSAHREIYKRCPVRKGDVLYIKDGATAGLATVNNLEDEFSMLSSVALLRPSPTVATPDFLALALNDCVFKQHALSRVVGGAMTRFTVVLLKRFSILIPPLAEQESIVSAVSDEMRPLRATQRKLEREMELLREYRTRLVADVVTGKFDVCEAAAGLPEEGSEVAEEEEFEEDGFSEGEETPEDIEQEIPTKEERRADL